LRDLIIRRCEPEDYKAVHLVYSSLQAMAETLGVPYSSEQAWREELSRQRDDNFAVVACVQGEVVGHLALSAPNITVEGSASRSEHTRG
jgi:putative acetyltransferase